MNIIIEGADALGKSTQIQYIKNEFEKRGKIVYIIHCSNFKFSDNKKEIELYSKKYYEDLLNFMANPFSNNERVLIFDRSYIGEYVYSLIYRNYNGSYVFDYENHFLHVMHSKTQLILFSDDPQKIIERDIARNDGKSFSLDLRKKTEEIRRFEKAFEKSKLDKKLIYLNSRDAETIWKDEVYPFIFR